MTDRTPDSTTPEPGEDDPMSWFEPLYAAAARGEASLPWDRRAPNPLLVEWIAHHRLDGHGKSALVVGSGLGDNAEHLASLGYETVAFDVSPSAIDAARKRFPGSQVTYCTADLLASPPEWRHRFDLVVEIYTVQALPVSYHALASQAIGEMVAAGGTLLVISSARESIQDKERPPWPLVRTELDAFAASGLEVTRVEELMTDAMRFSRHWRAEFTRPS